MKLITLFIFLLIPVFSFADSLDYKPVRKIVNWEVRVAYLQPMGIITDPIDYSTHSAGIDEPFDAFRGRAGLHAKSGINLGIARFCWHEKSSNSKLAFGTVISPMQFYTILYDLKSVNTPETKNVQNRFLYEYELSLGPAVRYNLNKKSKMIFYSRLGLCILRTKTYVEFVRTNFQFPQFIPKYSGNDQYINDLTITYNGMGCLAVLGSQIKYGKWNAGFEYHMEIGFGRYKSLGNVYWYYGYYRSWGYNYNTIGFKNLFLSTYLSRSF